MTITPTSPIRYRTRVAAHAYRVPVVRELPLQIAALDDRSTW